MHRQAHRDPVPKLLQNLARRGIQLQQWPEAALLFQRATPAVDLRIIDMRGSLVYGQHLTAQPEGARVLLPMQGLCAGLYSICLDKPEGRLVWKLVRF